MIFYFYGEFEKKNSIKLINYEIMFRILYVHKMTNDEMMLLNQYNRKSKS